MNAVEFVKKFGWEVAKQYLQKTFDVAMYCEPKIGLVIHQSVMPIESSDTDFVFHRDAYGNRLKQAIADVEKCQ